MDLGLRGKKAIVTGATRGIGRAIAEALVSEGVDVAICARNHVQVNETVDALRRAGATAIGGILDVSDGPRLRAWIEEAGQILGGIDILISNPGAMVGENTEKDWESNFRIDVMGAVRSVETAKPYLVKAAGEKGDASIVFIASVAASEAREATSYGPMKAALIHFAKGLARELAPKHVRANVVSPGSVFVKDGYWDKIAQASPDQFQDRVTRNPIGRMATANEIANAVVFLASPASAFITGINVIIDGGYTQSVVYDP
ncbi:MAG: SDR family oxidoreductase [Isosphaeraceae bacterium]|nr:SDR family oxidoreductase [Isosphaeraceae bacterium]